MSFHRLLVVLCWLLPMSAMAAEKHIWACRTASEGAQPILHLVEWEARSYVRFAHLRFSAEYQVQDDVQGWHFNNDGQGYYRYALLLDQQGKAWFHDFSEIGDDGLAAPLDYFLCSKTS